MQMSPPFFSLFFLGIVILRGSMGICLWWLPGGTEFLLSIPQAAAAAAAAAPTLPGPGWLSLAGYTSINSPSFRLALAPSSAAADTLRLRARLSSIVGFSSKPTPLSSKPLLCYCLLDTAPRWHRRYLLIPQGRETNRYTTAAMLPGSGGLLRWDLPAAGARNVALLPPTGNIDISSNVDDGEMLQEKKTKR